MATGPGLVHEDEATAPDDPQAEINKAEWNKAHRVKELMHITPGTVEPAAPLTGWIEFSIEEGVSPNKRIFRGIKLSTGEVIPILDVYV